MNNISLFVKALYSLLDKRFFAYHNQLKIEYYNTSLLVYYGNDKIDIIQLLKYDVYVFFGFLRDISDVYLKFNSYINKNINYKNY